MISVLVLPSGVWTLTYDSENPMPAEACSGEGGGVVQANAIKLNDHLGDIENPHSVSFEQTVKGFHEHTSGAYNVAADVTFIKSSGGTGRSIVLPRPTELGRMIVVKGLTGQYDVQVTPADSHTTINDVEASENCGGEYAAQTKTFVCTKVFTANTAGNAGNWEVFNQDYYAPL